MKERIKTEYAKAMVFCHDAKDDCPKNCPDYRKDVCAFGLALDFPSNREKDLAADLIDSRAHRDELLAALKALYGWQKAEVEHFGATCPDDFIVDMVEKALKNA